MLTPEKKAQWVSALRSGAFEQAHGRLRINHTYCCLGVACVVWGLEILMEDGVGNKIAGAAADGYYPLAKMGLSNRVLMHLWLLNDKGTSFENIADYIERSQDI